MQLPNFTYHPDPLTTGMIIQDTETKCERCQQRRGYIYVGPVFAEEEYNECICPWCIADGTAHAHLGAEFTDIDSIDLDNGSESIREIIAYKTPGFQGWQQEQWWTHCHDGAEFLGCVGFEELKTHGIEAMNAIKTVLKLGSEEKDCALIESLDREGSPSAYLFRCRHCRVFGGYVDCD